MAVGAGEIVAGITLGGVDGALADVARRLDDELPTVADEIRLRSGRQTPHIMAAVPVRVLAPDRVADADADDCGDEGRGAEPDDRLHRRAPRPGPGRAA